MPRARRADEVLSVDHGQARGALREHHRCGLEQLVVGLELDRALHDEAVDRLVGVLGARAQEDLIGLGQGGARVREALEVGHDRVQQVAFGEHADEAVRVVDDHEVAGLGEHEDLRGQPHRPSEVDPRGSPVHDVVDVHACLR